MLTTQELESKFSSGVYAKRGITIVKGSGALLYDQDGVEYIDCVGGQGAANLGHNHPEIVKAIAEQAQRIISCPEIFYNDVRAQLLEKLISIAGPNITKAFLCNSGTESVEAAIKFAKYSTKKQKVIAAMRGFHGRTLGSLSATWNKKYREPFEPLLPGFSHIPYNNIQKLKEAVDDKTAAVILEIVQGEGGVRPGDPEFLSEAQDICKQKGALLIIDEVQTGFGRTGRMFAYMHHNLEPDIICLGKSIAGGVPMGAVLLGERVGNLSPGIHGSTFGGNPLACAAAIATINIHKKEDLSRKAQELGQYALEELHRINSHKIKDIRGKGLMIGIEIREKVAPYLQAMASQNVLALPAGMTVIRLLPPLVIEKFQIEKAIDVLNTVLK